MNLYWRSRNLLRAGVLLVLFAVAGALMGRRTLSLLLAAHATSIRWRYVFVMLLAAVCVMSLSSPVRSIDLSDTGPLAKARRTHLLAGFAIGLLVCAASGLVADPDAWLGDVRAYVFWFGCALASAAALGDSMAWLVPVASLAPLILWGESTAPTPTWNWANAAVAAPVSWIVAAGALVAGIGAYWIGAELRAYRARPARAASHAASAAK
ncbi:MAG: hypothetical protein LBK95_14495 [Bifidobacteriaceae bacterium]|jgi:hypothetical protein|nr:hypothetical protein [Bifidobacteriaceae bacterium]